MMHQDLPPQTVPTDRLSLQVGDARQDALLPLAGNHCWNNACLCHMEE